MATDVLAVAKEQIRCYMFYLIHWLYLYEVTAQPKTHPKTKLATDNVIVTNSIIISSPS